MIRTDRVLEVRSDQLNADSFTAVEWKDFVLTGEVKDTKVNKQWQLEIGLVGEEKVYRPAGLVSAALICLYGENESSWAGQVLRLYRDSQVKFGNDLVGGIRISHCTGIRAASGSSSMSFITRGRTRKPFAIKEIFSPAAEEIRKQMMNVASKEEMNGIVESLKAETGKRLTDDELQALKKVYVVAAERLTAIENDKGVAAGGGSDDE